MANINKLTEILKNRVVISDGAMGTMLYQKGIFLNRCFDELNLSSADMVLDIHRQYAAAGADIITTNTFGANEFKLAKHGLIDQVEAINASAVEIARKAADSQCIVAGSIGPLGIEPPVLDENTDHAAKAFARQASALIKSGCDLISLETFSISQELLIAIDAVRKISDLPIIAHMSFNENNETVYGEKLEPTIIKIAAADITAVGLNCSVGPAAMLGALELIRPLTDKPISVQPNAGLPRQVDNRALYMSTPEYMAEYAKRFYETGAKIIGGCCGTTPAHISEIVRAVSSLSRSHTKVPALTVTESSELKTADRQPDLSLSEKSQLGKKIATNQKVFCIELTPPKGSDLTKVIEKAKLCKKHGIDAINIPDGPRASSRLSPIVTAQQIQCAAEIETVLHFCCRDRNLIAMQSDLLGCAALGIKNILIITGDPPKLGQYPMATGVFDVDAVALTSVLKNLNQGIDIGGNAFSPPLHLSIAVGANPVASNPQRELDRFAEKVANGAEYAITQPVFDPGMFFDFLEKIEPCKIPIIAGIWPFTSYKNAEFMANEVPGVVVPDALLERMKKTTTKEQGRLEGIKIAQEMIEKIYDHVAGFAVSAPFENVNISLAVLDKISTDEI